MKDIGFSDTAGVVVMGTGITTRETSILVSDWLFMRSRAMGGG
jgi:hypothetical protein